MVLALIEYFDRVLFDGPIDAEGNEGVGAVRK